MAEDIKTAIADEAVRIVTGARRSAYGTPESNFQRIADFWMIYFRAKGWTIAKVDVGAGPGESLDVQLRSWDNKIQPIDVAAMMRLMKEARLAETPDHLDSYIDLVGYALCGAEVAGVDGSGLSAQRMAAAEAAVEDARRRMAEAAGQHPVRANWTRGQTFSAEPGLQIEAGKFYRTRGGAVVGPMVGIESEYGQCWRGYDSSDGQTEEFSSDGSYYLDKAECSVDLIEEVPAP